MANKEISELTNKAAPVGTDEVEIQETGGGTSKKTTLQAIWDQMSDPFISDINGSLTTTGAANTYAVTLNSGYTSYFDGMMFAAQINLTNTGATTIDVNGLGARDIVNSGGSALAGSELVSGHIYTFRYDGARFRYDGISGTVAIGGEFTMGGRIRSSAANFNLYHAGADRITLTSSGEIGLTGVTTHDSNAEFSSGTGVDFSDAGGGVLNYADAGTWSPVIADAASGGNASPTSASGSFVRIGDICFAAFTVSNINDIGMTSGNDLYIQGLPFASHSTSSYFQGPVSSSVLGITTNNHTFTCFVDNSSTAGRIYENGINRATVKVSDITSGSTDITGTFIYRVA